MIVIGTALAVSPFNQSVNKIKDKCPCILFNMENTKEHGFDFEDLESRPGRLFVKGKCDESLAKLVRDVGWIEEFIAINPERMKEAGIELEPKGKEEPETKKEAEKPTDDTKKTDDKPTES